MFDIADEKKIKKSRLVRDLIDIFVLSALNSNV